MTVFVLAFDVDDQAVARAIAQLSSRDGVAQQDIVRMQWGSQGLPDAVSIYRKVNARIQACAPLDPSTALAGRHGILLVNHVVFQDLSPLIEGAGTWRTAVAMLMLTYPEFQWRFDAASSASGFPPGMQRGFDEFDRVFVYDADGRRDSLRQTICETGGHVLRRPARAAAIDDEENFATLHAYVAYRCGYRAEVITRWASLKRHADGASAGFALLFEDMSLRFPDRPKDVHIAELSRRAVEFPGLEAARAEPGQPEPRRWMVTAGRATPGHPDVMRTNQQHIDAWAGQVGGRGGTIAKPVAGIYDLMDKAGLQPTDVAPAQAPAAPADNGHGAPGKLALVARTLIERARAIRRTGPTLDSALVAAVCALDALELTAGQSPTLAFDALSLRHECEVIAECSFAGLQHSIEVQKRLRDITTSTLGLRDGFDPQNGERARISAEISIVNGVMRVFREHARFKEELECLNRIRDLDHELARWRRPAFADPGSCTASLGWLPSWYFKTLIQSPANFVIAILGWLLLLAMVFHTAGPPAAAEPGAVLAAAGVRWSALGCAAIDSFTSFFSMGAPVHPKSCEGPGGNEAVYSVTVAAGIFLGAIHLGVFISYIYTVLSRR